MRAAPWATSDEGRVLSEPKAGPGPEAGSPVVAASAVVYPEVTLGPGTVVEDFCILGCASRRPGDVYATGAGAEADKEAGTRTPTHIGVGSVIRSHTVIYAGTRIGAGFQSGNKANIREQTVIGDDVSVGALSVVEHHVTLGDRVRLHAQVFVPEYCVLEDDAWLGPNVVLTNARYPVPTDGNRAALTGVIVGRGARIGANVTVLPGVVVGAGALIGAGAVVTRDIEPGWVYVGNPARKVRPVDAITAYGHGR